MVHKTPMMKKNQRGGVTQPGGIPGPRLEPGPDGELDGERLLAGFATEPGRAQPEKAM